MNQRHAEAILVHACQFVFAPYGAEEIFSDISINLVDLSKTPRAFFVVGGFGGLKLVNQYLLFRESASLDSKCNMTGSC